MNIDNLSMDVQEITMDDNYEQIPNSLHDLLIAVQQNIEKANGNLPNALVYTIRKYKFWPAIQVKKFNENPNLVLLHNTYKRIDVEHFQNLYDESRSVILDLNLPLEQQIIASFPGNIPERISDNQYLNVKKSTDICDESFEGTIVTVYNYDNTWYMGTSSCPTIDSSRYFHPTKTHGNMFDEAIAKIYNVPFPTDKQSSISLRKLFTDDLDANKVYAFILVHYQNSHTIDYSSRFGTEYANLVHILTKSRNSIIEDDISSKPFSQKGILYTTRFNSPDEALQYIQTTDNTFGLIITDENGKRWKVSREEIIKHEEYDLGNPNVWYNMIAVYIKNQQHYKIIDYQRDFCPNLEIPKNSQGQELAPTYLIHTVICTMRDILLDAYIQTTDYNSKTKRYWMNKDSDKEFEPIIRFHLAQLRNIQLVYHNHAMLTPKAIYHYICHHQTIKNLRLLIKFFATKWFPKRAGHTNVPTRTEECFYILNNLLSK